MILHTCIRNTIVRSASPLPSAPCLLVLHCSQATTVRTFHRSSIQFKKPQYASFPDIFVRSDILSWQGIALGVAGITSSALLGWHVLLGSAEDVGSLESDGRDKGRIAFHEPSVSERLHFATDQFLHTSTYPRLAILGITTGLLLACGWGAFYQCGGVSLSKKEALWTAWTTIVDPGTHTLIPAGQGKMRSISVIFTLGGLIFFALLIGLMSDSISEYMDTLHSGNSRVLVRDHVLMLGWSEKIHSMLTERGSDVYSSTCKKFVVLAENPIEETDLEDRGVIFRRGHPSVVSDLIKVSPNTARSVIVFSPKCKDDDEADALVMARTMALISLDVKVPIVIEIRDRDNLAVVQKMLHGQTQLLHHKHRVVPLAGSDIAGKMVVQGALQPGLAKVVHHLLDWNSADQNDVHVQSIDRLPNVEGRTYGEAVFMFDDAIILGVMADRLQGVEGCPPNSCMLLNPPNDLVLQKGDKLCAVARSKDLFGPRDKPVRDSLGVLSLQHVQPDYQQKHLLIFNWRDDMEDMFRDIDKRVGKGSVVTVVSEFTKKERDELLEEGGGLRTLKNIKINHVRGQTVKQRVVKKVMSETHVDCVIVFSEDIEKHAPTADAKAVVCGLLVESLLPENGKCQTNPDNVEGQCAATESLLQPVSIITEIKERRSLQVLRVAGVSNFVIANELSGMMMVHLALEPDLRHFWIDNVFSALQGNNIDISLVDVYTHGLQPDVLAAMTFWDLLASCRYRGVTPIAIKRASDRTFTFNPADKNAPLKLKAGDTVVVVAPCHE